MKSPPETPASNDQQLGCWRDGHWLVVDLPNHRFPRRCLKSNQPVNTPPAHASFTDVGLSAAEIKRLSTVRVASSKTPVHVDPRNLKRVTVKLLLPLLPRYQWFVEATWAEGLFSVGWIAVLFSIAGMNDRVPLDSPTSGAMREFAFGLAGLCFPLGLFLTLSRWWIVRKQQIVDRKIWLAGVNRDWLELLPAFVPSRELAMRCWSHAFWWGVFWLALAGVFLGLLLWRWPAAREGYRLGTESRAWPETNAEIIAAEINEHTSARGRGGGLRTDYHVDFAYRYPIPGGHETDKEYEMFDQHDNAEQHLAKVRRAGLRLSVFFNPSNPSENRLQRGFSWLDLRELSLVIFLGSVFTLLICKVLGTVRDAIHWQRHLAEL